MLCATWHHFYNLKNVKTPIEELEVTLLHGCFSRFSSCTNGTKLRKASHICRMLFITTTCATWAWKIFSVKTSYSSACKNFSMGSVAFLLLF